MTDSPLLDKEENKLEKELEEPLKPLEVIVKNQPIVKEANPTSYDTVDEWNIEVTEEEMKEMQDAQ